MDFERIVAPLAPNIELIVIDQEMVQHETNKVNPWLNCKDRKGILQCHYFECNAASVRYKILPDDEDLMREISYIESISHTKRKRAPELETHPAKEKKESLEVEPKLLHNFEQPKAFPKSWYLLSFQVRGKKDVYYVGEVKSIVEPGITVTVEFYRVADPLKYKFVFKKDTHDRQYPNVKDTQDKMYEHVDVEKIVLQMKSPEFLNRGVIKFMKEDFSAVELDQIV